jgi:predicted SAM-dependent methyltransferase|tara:strand:+ start:204 stop:764 length:561 start_codon:yes stop_codon:yes gene_type:complete
MKLNIGCGENKLEGFINIDIVEGPIQGTKLEVHPDLIWDLTKEPLPYEDGSVDTIYWLHCIEHIQMRYWRRFFEEYHRLLKKDGDLVLAFPEFEICAKYFVDNYRGMKEFWRNTLYGRQLHKGDYHIAPVMSEDVSQMLLDCGFKNIISGPEPVGDYYTIMRANRSVLLLREDIIANEIFGVELPV